MDFEGILRDFKYYINWISVSLTYTTILHIGFKFWSGVFVFVKTANLNEKKVN